MDGFVDTLSNNNSFLPIDDTGPMDWYHFPSLSKDFVGEMHSLHDAH